MTKKDKQHLTRILSKMDNLTCAACGVRQEVEDMANLHICKKCAEVDRKALEEIENKDKPV